MKFGVMVTKLTPAVMVINSTEKVMETLRAIALKAVTAVVRDAPHVRVLIRMQVMQADA